MRLEVFPSVRITSILFDMPAPRALHRSRLGAVLLAVALAAGASSSLTAAPATAQQTVAPGKPVVGALTGGDGQVVVNFWVPTPGTDPITGYQVQARNINDWNEVVLSPVGPTSPIVVTGLTNGASYTFWVTALSANGSTQSEESDALAVGIVPSFPSPPTNLPPATVGEPYSYTFNAAGAPIPTVVWVPSASPVPPGLTYDFVTRTLSGTPTTAGTIEVLLAAHNALGFADLDTTLEIREPVGEPEPNPTPSPSPSPSPTSPADPSAKPTPPAASAATATKPSAPAPKARALPSTGIEPFAPFILGSIVLTLGAALIVARTAQSPRRASNGDDRSTH